MKLLLKLLTIIFGSILIFFYFIDFKIEKSSYDVQNMIDLKMPMEIKKGIIVQINELKLKVEDSELFSELNFNLNSSILKKENQKAKISIEPYSEERKLLLKINSIEIKETKEEIEPVGKLEKFINFIEKKTVDYVNNDDSKIVKIINDRKVVLADFDKYSVLLKDIQIKTFNDDYQIVILLTSGLIGFLIGIGLILLGFGREISILLINIYQKYFSPKKGYKCAHGVRHKNGTCSSITKEAFIEDGLFEGIVTYFRTTKQCKQDYDFLKSNKKSSGNKDCDDTCNCGDVGHCDGPGGCDINPC